MNYRTAIVCLVAAATLLIAVPVQAQRSLDINLGAFVPATEDMRTDRDVLVANRQFLYFEMEDLAGFFGEAALSTELGEYFETSVGVGFYQATAPSVDEVHVWESGGDIQQDLKLRNVPVTLTVRMFPIGHRRMVQPYVGVGAAANFWRYSETGDWVDTSDDSIYRESYLDSGTAFGPVGVVGVRARMTAQADLGAEFRYQWAEGKLNSDNFTSDRIDLGGATFVMTFKFRF
jgi:outer membrane protein W